METLKQVEDSRSMNRMRLILTLLMTSCSVALSAQLIDSITWSTFEGKSFKTDQIIGFKDYKYDSIVSTIELSEFTEPYAYGDITRFENGVFSSGNVGPCGNECRITVLGAYAFKGNKIHLFLESISFWKECHDQPEQIINNEIGTFSWYKGEDGTITLTSEE